jgi:D-arabinose 1-dehydrogenase-like Zn-dependent alcohol dehydrogenase
MKAVRIHQFGGPEVLTYEDVPDPQLRKDQVMVRVRACSLNHLDVWVRKGLPGVKLPHILGSDIAGDDGRNRRLRWWLESLDSGFCSLRCISADDCEKCVAGPAERVPRSSRCSAMLWTVEIAN